MVEDNIIDGIVEEIIFESDDSGYKVFSVDMDGQLITAVCTCAALYVGESITAHGEWTNHAVYGRQFVCDEIEKSFPVETQSMLKFLASGIIKGIGAAYAHKIVEIFGEDTFYIIENEPNQLTQIKGISSNKAMEISHSFKQTLAVRETLMELGDMGISPAMAVQIHQKYGGMSIQIVRSNPYQLWEEIDGFSFGMADKLALENGFEPLDDLRIEYCIKYVLVYNQQNGHVFLPLGKLKSISAEFIGISNEQALEYIEKLVASKKLKAVEINGLTAVYLIDMFEAEQYIATKLRLICDFKKIEISNIETRIASTEKILGIEYAQNQRQAVKCAIENKTMVLTGGPGTGKTTTLRGIITLFEDLNYKVVLCAPTGRAAKRMSELCGRPAKTIHRLLEIDVGKGAGAFTRNENNPLDADVLIVDEMSMVDVKLFEGLMHAIRTNCRLVLVGDSDQLPSVGAGNVFLDIIRSQTIATIFLNKIFRQASKSHIILNAHKINRGEYPDLTNSDDFYFIKKSSPQKVLDAVIELVANRIPKVYKKDVFNGLQVIIPTKKTTVGTANVNKQLHEILNPPSQTKRQVTVKERIYREGDKVMQTKNNYDIVVTKDDGTVESGVYNGDIGIIEKLLISEKKAFIRYDDRLAEYEFSNLDQVESAYAITIHKSQGSEFDAVVLVLSELTPLLQYRNLLYTAVTRAKQILVIVGSESIITKMVDNNKRSNRYSGLKYFLKGDWSEIK